MSSRDVPMRVKPGAEELAKAQLAYRGALEAARAWRIFSPNSRHHDMTYWSMLTSLFAEPGMNRTRLIERIMDYAGVSRSTAERTVREGRANGFVVDHAVGNEVHYFLSDVLNEHCIDYFRRYLDQERMMQTLGYSD